jgi:YcaO-like protein with predicted kinase domain
MHAQDEGRARPAADTYAIIEPHFARLGIARLARQTGLDRIGIPCFAAIRPNSRTLAAHYGKGISDIAAKTAAVMEALEFWVAESSPGVTRRVSTRRALLQEGAAVFGCEGMLPPGQCLDSDLELIWGRGTLLAGGEVIWVPLDAIALGDAEPAFTAIARTTNGLASGNTRDEAILHGLCELIERDALTLWSFRDDASALTAALRPADFGDSTVDRLAAQVESAGLHLRLFDITSDLQVPVIHALISEAQAAPMRLFDLAAGTGCHPVASRAAIAAITEAAQSRLTNIAGSRDDYSPTEYQSGPDAAQIGLLGAALYRTGPPANVAASLDPAELIRAIHDRLERRGIGRVVVVDLGGQEMGVSVIRVLCPELEDGLSNAHWRPGPRAFRAMMGFAV